MPFTVRSRVNHPLAITLDAKNSLHLGPYDEKQVENQYRKCDGISRAIRNNSLRVAQESTPEAHETQVKKENK